MEKVITDIPVSSKEVYSFNSSTIEIIPEEDRISINNLVSATIKEPMFKVVEGERNYIYSFSKIFAEIKTEITRLKERRFNTFMLLAVSIIVFVFSFNFKTGGVTPIFGFMAGTLIFSLCVYDLATTRYMRLLKNLETKKTYVLNESQTYLKNLEQEVKKPVVVV